jgi:stress response protein SCP2
MVEINRGFRTKLTDYFDLSKDISINLLVQGNSQYDTCCFGLDIGDKLSDDTYMVFYNQKSSLKGEINLERAGNDSLYRFNLSKLPDKINKLAFTISIDGEGTMGDVRSVSISLSQKGGLLGGKKEDVLLNLLGSSFQQEKALIGVEIYRKDVWRLAAVASGFNGGLSALLKHYGGEEIQDSESALSSATVTGNKVALEKRLETEAPQLVSLVKPLKVVLEKKNLSDTVARVGLVMDISGSMGSNYRNGTVQDVINKIVPLAVQFDDDGELDLWYFGSRPKRMDSVTTKNYKTAVPDTWPNLMSELGYGNNEPVVMDLVVKEYATSKLPAYIIFISDGGVSSEEKIKDILKSSSKLPIFWQFVGLGRANYGVLKRLDTMKGRFIDNANFFAIDNYSSISDEQLYDQLLGEFPQWLEEARKHKILK